MNAPRKKLRQPWAIIIAALLALVGTIYSKLGKFESPYFSSFRVEYNQELMRLQEAKGANELLQKQWDDLRLNYKEEMDATTNLELLSIGEDIAARQDEIEVLLEQMTHVDLWDNERSRLMLSEAKERHADVSVVDRISAISSAIPEQMLFDLRHELELGNSESQRLAEQVGQLQRKLAEANRELINQNERLDSLHLLRQEMAVRDSIARSKQIQDSIENARLISENEKLVAGIEKMPEVTITNLQFMPTKAKKDRNNLYNRKHVENEGFSVSFVPEVYSMDGGVHRSLLLLFEYPSGVEEATTRKPLTKKMNITSGVLTEFQHTPQWPKTGTYTVTIKLDDRVLDKASFEVQ